MEDGDRESDEYGADAGVNVVLRTEVGIELRSVLYIGKVKEGPFF